MEQNNPINIILGKFFNSLDKWIFPVVIAKNGDTYIRFFMKEKDCHYFSSVYTYKTEISRLIKFFAQKSYGQGYNKYFKYEDIRASFDGIKSKETGTWTIFEVLNQYKEFNSNLSLQWLFTMTKNHYDSEFNIESISEEERTSFLALKYEKEQEELANKIKKEREEFRILGGDY